MSLMAEATLSLGDYGAIGAMFAAVAGITTTLLIANIRGLGQRIDVIEHRVAKVERYKADAEALTQGLRELAKGKADKHEFGRENILARDKMGELGQQLARLDAKLDANFGIAAAVNRLADEFGKNREAQSHG